MRKGVCLSAAVILLLFFIAGAAEAQNVTINATPSVIHLGDTVLLTGNVSGVHTIAVYLFLAGPDLDSRGVTLENVNVPAGRGLFTTAPVNMKDGTWIYPWDTSVILGNLNPGTYTVYVVTTPVDHERFGTGSYASARITILPEKAEPTPLPVSPWTALVALGVAASACACIARRRNNE